MYFSGYLVYDMAAIDIFVLFKIVLYYIFSRWRIHMTHSVYTVVYFCGNLVNGACDSNSQPHYIPKGTFWIFSGRMDI